MAIFHSYVSSPEGKVKIIKNAPRRHALVITPCCSNLEGMLAIHKDSSGRWCQHQVLPLLWVCLKMLCTPKPNGFADHYPVFKWLYNWEYTLFSDKPNVVISCHFYWPNVWTAKKRFTAPEKNGPPGTCVIHTPRTRLLGSNHMAVCQNQ